MAAVRLRAFVAIIITIAAVALTLTLAEKRAEAPSPEARPDLTRPGPWDNDVLVYRLTVEGGVEKLATFERAGVPTVARLKDGRLIAGFQHFPASDDRNFDRVAVRFSGDEGRTWSSPVPIAVEGMEPGLARPFDPTLVSLPDGRIRLYFTSNRSPDFSRSTPAIYSAISSDGLHYAFEPGVRFAVEERLVIDCAITLHDGVFHLIVPNNGTAEEMAAAQQRSAPARGEIGYHALSRDGLHFERVADVTLPAGSRWLGNLLSDGGRLVFFGTGVGPWPVASADGVSWQPEAPGTQLPGADPGAVKLKDGHWLLVVTGPPRPGTLSAQQRRQDAAGPLPTRSEPLGARGQLRIDRIDSQYAVASAAAPGRFVTGQAADIVLGAKGFNNAGGPLFFNHPSGLATDGKALLMTDRWNNRVLLWKSAPARNIPPDLVLGQPDFTQNNPGAGRANLNWPGNVAITPDGQRIAVTDTNNDRVLLWNSFPTKNGAPADVVLDLAQLPGGPPAASDATQPRQSGGMRFGWPWGVWTDGRKFAVVATQGSAVLIWNAIPTLDNQPPDIVLSPNGAGTPRNITSDGATFFAVSDHNNGNASRPATMVWRSFPTSSARQPDFKWNEWVKGSLTPDGKLVVGGIQSVYIWNEPPRDAEIAADVVLRPPAYRNGDGPDAVVANGRLYVSNYNSNNLLGWNALPTRHDQPPDFSIGSDTPGQDTWAENFFIQNPVVATDGRSLFVTSDFDRKMFVWRSLPDESAAWPDLVFNLPEGPWDNELHNSTLAVAGKNTVYLWRKLPLNGETPDVTLSGSIGGTRLGEITGVAFDDRYFYLSDRRADAIYVWEGIPTGDSAPKYTLSMRSPGRLNSDGHYLAAAPFEGQTILLWRVSELGSHVEPLQLGGRGQFNLPSECLIADGHVFVANRSFNRVDVWNRLEDALAGKPADALLGAAGEQDRQPAIGRSQLFMPGSVAWGGGYLWVGEFKFSTRILRFSPQSTTTAARNPGQP